MITVYKVWFEEDKIFVELNDKRVIGTPISWYPNLAKGSKEQLLQFELWNDGQWIHWEALNEDLSADGFLRFKTSVANLSTI